MPVTGYQSTTVPITMLSGIVVIFVLLCVVCGQDGDCTGAMECRDQQDCKNFLQEKDMLRLVDRKTEEYRATLSHLKSLICNKREKKVCCELSESEEDIKCSNGRECLLVEHCPLFQLERSQLNFIEKGSQEYQQKLTEIKALMCNRKKMKVCCFKIFLDTVKTNSS